ncbi:MAG: flavodoxin domain-containing protein [Emergencia sp.]
MKTAVIYAGKYGTTEQYAKWIAEETGADLFREEDCRKKDFSGYDAIVFGGAVHAGGILGISTLRKISDGYGDKKIIAFAVGLNVADEETQAECRELNFQKQPSSFRKLLSGGRAEARMSDREEAFSRLPCYFFPGAYDPEKVSGIDRKMMGMVKKMIGSKADSELTAAEKKLLDAIEHGADYTDRAAAAPLIEELKK